MRRVALALLPLLFACEDPTGPVIDETDAVQPHWIGGDAGGEVAGLRAAVTLRGKGRLFNHARVSGFDPRRARFRCDDCERTNVAGILVADATQIRYHRIKHQRRGRIRGLPPVLVDPDLGDEPFTTLGSKTWDEIAAMATAVVGEAGTQRYLRWGKTKDPKHFGPSVTADGACDIGDPHNFGSNDPDHPCFDYFPIVLIRGRVVLRSRGYAQGVFILDVDANGEGSELDLEGWGLRVNGIVLGRGCVEVGNRTRLRGAVVVDGSVPAKPCRGEKSFEMHGRGNVQWSSAVVTHVLDATGISDDTPQPPTASFDVTTAVSGSPTVVDAIASTDPQGGPLTFDWDFGDGGRGGASQMAHIYAEGGTYDIVLTVTNEAGLTATATQTVTIDAGLPATGSATVAVFVTDNTGVPVANITVEGVLGADDVTDDVGVALVGVPTGIPSVIKLTAPGFVDQFVRVELATGLTEAVVEAVIIARAAPVSLDAAAGGTVVGAAGVAIEIPAGALIDNAGSPVVGAVDVAVTPIDVSGDDISAFPGSFAGVSGDGTQGPILTFGVAEFQITQGGEVLDLAPGARATIEIPIFSGSPVVGEVIELWTLDETSGVWIVEGTGEVVSSVDSPTGLALRAEIGHLSWWNCDIRFLGELFTPTVRCVDEAGQSVPCFVQARAVDAAFPRGGASDHVPAEGKTLIFASNVEFRIQGTALIASALLRGETTFIGAPGGMDLVVITLFPIDAGTGTWVTMSAGESHTCGIREGGALFCWGESDLGQLGTTVDLPADCFGGEVQCATLPTPVEGGLTFMAVSAAAFHTCGITTDGLGYCWGDNVGQLGDGTTLERPTPVAVAGGLTFSSISSGPTHTCGVATDGTGYCWGVNDNGQLGTGVAGPALVPTPIAGGLTFTSVSAGAGHSCGLATDGTAYCWGLNDFGQLGDGTQNASQTPIPVAGLLTFQAVAAGYTHSCGVATDASLYCWGDDFSGQLGSTVPVGCEIPAAPRRETQVNSAVQLSPGECSFTPSLVDGGLMFASVTPGINHTCGITTNGAAYCWGYNGIGQLGDGTNENRETPVAVVGGFSFKALDTGGSHTCGVTMEGVGQCWGNGEIGQRGDGTTDDSPTPIPVTEP